MEEKSVRDKIIKAATDILKETKSIENVTVREIANRAKVGIGSINYHFKSKDFLLSEVIENIMTHKIHDFTNLENDSNMSADEELKALLKALCDSALGAKELVQFMLKQDIFYGSLQTPLYLVPLLRRIFGASKSEMELRVIALQLLQPLQIAGITPDAFLMYSGFDVYNRQQRNKFIDMLVDNLVK